MESRERILVVRLSSAGDILQALPALAILRRRRPDARITFLVEDRFRPFVEGRPELDGILEFPRARSAAELRAGRPAAAAAAILAFQRALGTAAFDTALDFQGNLKSGVQAFLSRAPLRVGFRAPSSREGNALFTNRTVVPRDEAGSRVRKYVDLLAGIGITGEEPRPVAPPRGAHEAFRAAVPALAEVPFRVLHPGTSPFGAYKRWPRERWLDLARALAARDPVLVSAGPGEEDDTAALAALPGVHRATGPLSVPALAGALARARAFVGADSAPLHLAHALGCPAVGLFGPTSVDLYRPWMCGVAVTASFPCAPCPDRGCPGLPCMEAIAVEEVLSAVEDLERGGAGNG